MWPGVGLLDHMVDLFLVFLRNLHIVPHNRCTNLQSSQQRRRFPFRHILSSIVCRFFDDGHSDQCEVVPHLIYISLIISDVEHLSSV